MRTALPLLLVLVLVLAACEASCSSTSKADAPTHNVAVDTVKYAESGATCEPGFALEAMHTARCTLPSGLKIYCTTGANGWHCDQLAAPKAAEPAKSTAPQGSQP